MNMYFLIFKSPDTTWNFLIQLVTAQAQTFSRDDDVFLLIYDSICGGLFKTISNLRITMFRSHTCVARLFSVFDLRKNVELSNSRNHRATKIALKITFSSPKIFKLVITFIFHFFLCTCICICVYTYKLSAATPHAMHYQIHHNLTRSIFHCH